jgi:putative hydrolase of the HAD superfamily
LVLTDKWGHGYWKPHERAFEYVQQGAPGSERFVYIADNVAKDFIAPRRMGWETVRVRRPLGLHAAAEAVEGAGADWEIADLSRLDEVLKLKPVWAAQRAETRTTA